MTIPKIACAAGLMLSIIVPALPIIAADALPAPKEPPRDIVQLTRGFVRAGEAYFSPDMKWIIFQAVPQGQEHYQMYVAPVKWDGEKIGGAGDPIRISPDKSRNTCGFFSPDGRSLIFGSTVGKEKPDEATGGYQREGRNYRWSFPEGMEIHLAVDWAKALAGMGSINHPDMHVKLPLKALTDNNVYDAECAFSPDGQWIVYASGAGPEADIYIMRADGSNKVRITDAKGYDGGPFFSPDGKRLVYRSDRKGNDLLQVFVADLAFDDKGNSTGMKKEHQLTDDQNVNWGPYWHPAGRHIVYATSIHGHRNYELYLMRDDGTEKTRITFTEGPDILPVFSPDGKWLMWTSRRSTDGSVQVFVGRFNGRL